MSLFITFEGGEGSGKTAQARALYRRLLRAECPVLFVHEPGSTRAGERIARWLKWAHTVEITPLTELMMFNASRAQLVEEVIRPELAGGKVVICDRFTASTLVYQGYGRGLEPETVRKINDVATGRLRPDLTVLLDVPVEVGFKRKHNESRDRFEQEDSAFHQRVREGFLKLAEATPGRWLVIDATQTRKQIANIIWERVSGMLGRYGIE